ncbi:MAG: hypothetical protein WCT31_00545, partial [Candidatus Micrarchaeia archaeon]
MILKQDSGIGRFGGFQKIDRLLLPLRNLDRINVLVDSLHPVHKLNDIRRFMAKLDVDDKKLEFHGMPERRA